MMPEIIGAMLSLSRSPVALAVAKVTITTALSLLCVRLARRSRAAVRHALLAVAFGVLVALPLVSVITPPVGIAVRVAAPAQTATVPLVRGSGAIVSHTAADLGAGGGSAISRPPRFPSFTNWLLTGWMAGAALFLLPMVMGLRRVRSLRRSGVVWPQGQSVAEGLAKDAGIRRRFQVLLEETLPGPMTCGVVRTAIVLPPDARNWDAEDLNRAMVHELEHVRRRDWISQSVARAICAVYWFHPLVWLAWRQLTVEAERACDDAVVRRSEATAYADQLVELAQRLSLVSKKPVAKSPLLAMASRADLATRVSAVLDTRQRRGRAGVLPVALACAAAAVLVGTISPLRMVAAPQRADTVASTTGAPPLSLSTVAALVQTKSRLRIVAAPQAAADTTVRVTPIRRFSSTTNLVLEYLVVTDQNGATIEGLGPQDFTVTDASMGQLISIFEFVKRSDTTPGAPSQPSYYILGYYPSSLNVVGKFRKIQIGLNRADAAIASRLGYWDYRGFGAVASPAVLDDDTAGDPSLPVLTRKILPEYSEQARKAKWQGTSALSVQLDDSGRVTNIDVIRTLGYGLDEKAVEAVKQWQFTPGMKDGLPVAVKVQVDLSFRLL